MSGLLTSRRLIVACALLIGSSAFADRKKPHHDDSEEKGKDEPKNADEVTVTDDDPDDTDRPKKKEKKKSKDEETDDSAKPSKKKDADSESDADSEKKPKKKHKDADADAETDSETKPKKKHKDADADAASEKKIKKKHKDADSEADADAESDRTKTKKKHKDADSESDPESDKVKTKKRRKDADSSDEEADSEKIKSKKKHKDADSEADSESEKIKTKRKRKDADSGDEEADSDKIKSKRKHQDADGDAEIEKAKIKKKHDAFDRESKNDSDPIPVKTKGRKKGHGKTTDKVDTNEIEMDDPSSTEGRVEAAPLPGTEGVAAPLPGEPTTTTTASVVAMNDRSLTIAKDKIEVHGGFPISVLTLTDVAGNKTSSTSEGFAFGATYGIGDKLEIGGDYALSLSPGQLKGPLTFRGAYRWKHDDKLDVALAGAFAIDFFETTNVVTMMTSTSTSFALQLGAWARYRLAPKVSVFSGLPALPNSSVSLSKLSFALPPLPYQIALGLNNGGLVAIELPIGLGFQASPNIYAFAALNLANIRIANSQNAFIFADFIPISIGGFYSKDQFDVGAVLSDDLKQGAGYLRFQLLGRYFFK